MMMPGTDQLAPGPLRDLVAAVHQLHAEAGLPSTRKISAAIRASGSESVSHETVSAMLRGSALPRWLKLEAVVRQLAQWSPARTDPDRQVQRFQVLWLRASDPSAAAVLSSSSPDPAHDEPPAADRPTAWPLRVGVVPAPAHGFQERHSITLALDFSKPHAVVAVLTGLGGVGKTQLAAQLVRREWTAGHLDLLVWVNVASRHAVVSTYAEAAHRIFGLDVGESDRAADRFLVWLAATKQRWLVVLDDVEFPADLNGLWPPRTASGRTVVTTRRRDAALRGEGRMVVDVGVMTPDEAAAYLAYHLGDDRLDGADQLAAELGYLPLALAQAVAYMNDRGLDVPEYRARFADRRARLETLVPEQDALPDQHASTVATTWLLSVELADRLIPTGVSEPLLRLTSMLDPNGVPLRLLSTSAVLEYLSSAVAGRGNRPVTARDAADAIRNLHRLNLVILDAAQETARVHSLVQRATRDALSPHDWQRAVHAAADGLIQIWPEFDAADGAVLRGNGLAVRTNAADLFVGMRVHPVLFRIGRSLMNAGLVTSALDYFDELVATLDAALGADHPDTLAARSNWAVMRGEAGAPAAAVHTLTMVFEAQLRILGPDHPVTLTTRRNRASWLSQAGDIDGALRDTRLLVDDLVRMLGSDHPITLSTRHNLATLTGTSGDHESAIAMLNDVLVDLRRVDGAEHPNVTAAEHNLADLRGRAGDAAGAVGMLKEVLDRQERVLGSAHPDTLASSASLARWVGEAGDPAGAAQMLGELSTVQERVLGVSHRATLATRANFARWTGEAGDAAGAAAMLAEVARDQERVLGKQHPDARATLANLEHWHARRVEAKDTRVRVSVTGLQGIQVGNNAVQHNRFAAGVAGSSQPVWRPVFEDPLLSRPPTPGGPGNVPIGGDLDLSIGWDRFEQLMVFVVRGFLGLDRVKFRRYGLPGQAQHGIDLAGRHADGTYTVVQCKEYTEFTPADLRKAVTMFAAGTRPFGAQHLIIAVSVANRATQVEHELATLQDQHPDLDIELWGAEQINDVLRERADIVARFWTRETAATFCTGAPLPGVAAPPPDWTRVADQVLLTPLGMYGLDEQLAEADRLRAEQPLATAETYARLADRLDADGYTGHAHVMRRRQLDALAAAGEDDARAALAAQLAATALHEGDVDLARMLNHNLDPRAPWPPRIGVRDLAGTGLPAGSGGPASAATRRHSELISAAVDAATHQLADSSALITVLRRAPDDLNPPDYQPLLVLLAAELSYVDAIITPPDQPTGTDGGGVAAPAVDPVVSNLAELADLISAALNQLESAPPSTHTKDVTVRLRMVQAIYDSSARAQLLTLARQRRIERHHAALILAAQARREAINGSAEDAIEHWRQAVEHAIHDGRTDDAAAWLYAIRAVNVMYGPWTNRIDEEHMLAQALPKTGIGRLIRRTRDPENHARRAALNRKPIEAIRAARRWLADCVVVGDWADEKAAAELLGDLYADNKEPNRAANCYQWAGATKKATALADAIGDHLLPRAPIGSGPWWQRSASLAIAATQHDLIDDPTAAALLRDLIDLVTRGRTGELADNPARALTERATKTMLILAGRGSSQDAQTVLDVFAGDVARATDYYYPHDEQHVQACLAIAAHHTELQWPALVRLFDLAEAGAYEALRALHRPAVRDLLDEPSTSGTSRVDAPPSALTGQQRQALRDRLHAMAAAGQYDAGLATAMLADTDAGVMQQAAAARDRLLNRPDPDGRTHAFGTTMVPDSYLVTVLDMAGQQACLDKTLAVAEDRREAASNRQDALTAAANLVQAQPDGIKAGTHARSRAFVAGDHDGSALDDRTTNPHPLSSFKVNLRSPSLRAHGLRLAQCSAVGDDDRAWVRDQAMVLLSADDRQLVRESAQVLSQLGVEVTCGLDVTFLVGHPDRVVREFAAFVAATAPLRYTQILPLLAHDPDWTVRVQLALGLHAYLQSNHDAANEPKRCDGDQQRARAIAEDVLTTLSGDVRHRVRRAVAGHKR